MTETETLPAASDSLVGSRTKFLLGPSDRDAAIEQKRRAILDWFRLYPWTHVHVLQEVLSFGRRAVEITLSKMQRDAVIRSAEIPVSYGRPIRLWGVTHAGSHLSFALAEELRPMPVFEPSKVAASTLNHDLDVQLLHARAVKAGWKEWTPAQHLASRLVSEGLKIPDAVATNPKGERVAIEVERTLKSNKRYADLLVSYLWGRKAGHWNRVLYLSPTEQVSARVDRAYRALRTARHQGAKIEIQPAHLEPFSFITYARFLEPHEEPIHPR